MGESICLVRSFSQPAVFSSHETNEAVPRRVLTESVSFGRFANETLSWEKWSAFTQNRYLEEVERFTKPGSVAEKKAFFEAHFKNRTAGRGKQMKTENVKATITDAAEIEMRKDNLVDSEVPLGVNNGMAMDGARHGEVSNAVAMDGVVPSISVIVETAGVQTGKVEVTTHVDSLNSMVNPEDKALDGEHSTSLGKERPPSSSGLKACSRSSKLEPSFVIGPDHSLKNTRKESSSSSKRSISVSKNRSRSPAEPFHLSIGCTLSDSTDKKVVGMPQNGFRSSTNAKSAGKADKMKRSDPSSVHMSLHFASSACQMTKTAPKNLARNSTTQETTSSNARNSGNEPTGASKSRKRPLPRTSKEGSKAAKCSTSASSARLPELPPPKNHLPENKRKNITAGSSVSSRISNSVQRQPSVGRENISTHSRTKAKSLTVSSPFNFRSDERAERRKEFFMKLEEKNKKKDTGKDKLSCGFKANQKAHLVSEEHKKNPQVGGFQVPLISLTSPRFCRNQTPRTENIKKSHQTPQKVSSRKIINIKTAVMEEHKSCKIHPASRSQTTKKTEENMPPNFLQNRGTYVRDKSDQSIDSSSSTTRSS